MDETDAESFDKFIERHWGNKARNTETVTVSSNTQVTPRRRGRPAKKII